MLQKELLNEMSDAKEFSLSNTITHQKGGCRPPRPCTQPCGTPSCTCTRPPCKLAVKEKINK